MHGFITTRDVLRHPICVIREFGVRVFVRCLVGGVLRTRKRTFLECIEFRRRLQPDQRGARR